MRKRMILAFIVLLSIATKVWSTEMVLVEGGTFNMGALGYAPQVHPVTLDGFYIGKYEITQGEWSATMGNNPSQFSGSINNPVETVSWYDAMVFCNKKSIIENLTPVYSINNSTNPADWGAVPAYSSNSVWDAAVCNWLADGYRLPTEAEWEYAARGGKNSSNYNYSGSNNLNEVGWCYNNADNHTTSPVGQKQANELGIYDMSGNVEEWNWDWHSPADYSNEPQNNPHGPVSGNKRICRGGSYYTLYSFCLSAYRNSDYQENHNDDKGFRVARKNTTHINSDLFPTSTANIQNYPNPFNPTTNICYSLTSTQNIKITIYNANGELVTTLIDGMQNAGQHSISFNGSKLTSGIYFYKLEIDGKCLINKMILAK